MKKATLILMFICLMVVLPIINGYVLTVVWTWFICPLFDVPLLTVPYAIGICLTVRFITNDEDVAPSNSEGGIEELKTNVLKSCAKPIVVLTFGWVVKQWV